MITKLMHIRYVMLRNRVPQDGHTNIAFGKDCLHFWQTVARLLDGLDDAEVLVDGHIADTSG